MVNMISSNTVLYFRMSAQKNQSLVMENIRRRLTFFIEQILLSGNGIYSHEIIFQALYTRNL